MNTALKFPVPSAFMILLLGEWPGKYLHKITIIYQYISYVSLYMIIMSSLDINKDVSIYDIAYIHT